jgi:UDP-N-acetylmuramoyl-tripeptide--D-alanyl-D-alanine ligase
MYLKRGVNMFNISLENLALAIEGEIVTTIKNNRVDSVINHPNLPKKYCMYYLFELFQGEEQLLEKLKKYPVSCIVVKSEQIIMPDKWEKENISVLKVENPHLAYFRLAEFYRAQFSIPLIEVVGSSGKTTTKEMIGAVLNEQFNTYVGLMNYNAPKGVAFNLLNLRTSHQAAVLEAGMSALGHIHLSSSMIKPMIGVVTSLQRAHIAKLGSMENIIKAKSEVLDFLSNEGCLILNAEDENCKKFPYERYKGEVLWYGYSKQCDIWATDIRVEGEWSLFTVHTKDLQFECKIHTFGKYNVGNALAAILVGLKLGMDPERIAKGLAEFTPPPSRLEVSQAPHNITIINDNFNANPDSTTQLLNEIPSFANTRPILLVMGDMENPNRNEEYAKKVHYEIGQQIGNMNLLKLIAIGKWAKEYVNGALSQGISQDKLVYFPSVAEAAEDFKNCIIPNCMIVLKASSYVQVQELLKLIDKEENT